MAIGYVYTTGLDITEGHKMREERLCCLPTQNSLTSSNLHRLLPLLTDRTPFLPLHWKNKSNPSPCQPVGLTSQRAPFLFSSRHYKKERRKGKREKGRKGYGEGRRSHSHYSTSWKSTCSVTFCNAVLSCLLKSNLNTLFSICILLTLLCYLTLSRCCPHNKMCLWNQDTGSETINSIFIFCIWCSNALIHIKYVTVFYYE